MRSAAVLLAAAFLLAASAAPKQLADDDRRRIEQLAQRYFERRADKVTSLPWRPGFGVPTTEALAAQLSVDEARLERGRERRGAFPDGGYSRAHVTTTPRRVQVDQDGTVVLHLHEHTDLYFEKSTTVDHTGYGMPHVLIFTPSAAGWVLAAAMYPPGSVCKVPPETQFCGSRSER
ncbi:hypothetical protein SAMN04488074_111103 [Lentzea albidocapillata subsp. violacea]|uniref:Uncharacterized protein n=1 Tax=Lentzea albidocapillata subsp. violacea TaxID=128104 RepID=A0A1G9KDI3_9PSEU|nr:hypothetical protein [Lentzea albidocapillata]SDL47393.1 hypothetical protein SAMN04488074_111103 [Lentzea albidocapillata subsp. violacea]